MRSGQRYKKTEEREGLTVGTYYATVISFGSDTYKCQSWATLPTEPTLPSSFLDVLHSVPNQEMWSGMSLDEDKAWILDVLLEETLDISHDGSYQPEISKDVSYCICPLQKGHNTHQAIGLRYLGL